MVCPTWWHLQRWCFLFNDFSDASINSLYELPIDRWTDDLMDRPLRERNVKAVNTDFVDGRLKKVVNEK